MNATPDPESTLAAEAIDAVDARLLTAIRDMHETLDPVPEDLLGRIKFAMTVRALEAEVAEIVSSSQMADVRGTHYDRADTVTFGADGISLMVTIEHGPSTRSDIIGWVSQSRVEVELRERTRTRTTTVDAEGRFSFAGVERGLVNFVLRRLDDPAAAPIITPAVEM